MSSTSAIQVLVPLDHAVLPNGYTRNAFSESLVCTTDAATGHQLFGSLSQPFIAAHHSFERLFSKDASVRVLASKQYPFAHEAGVYSSLSHEVWFTSNLLERENNKVVEINRISLNSGFVSTVNIDQVRLGNGGCKFRDGVLFCDQGSYETPSQLVYSDFRKPSEARPILNNFNGRRFNSLNDVAILSHASGQTICFTDPPYGSEQGFRPPNQLPPAVWAFDPEEGHVRMLDDSLKHPNGIAFSPSESTCYVTDTSHIHGSGRLDASLESTIYAFDVIRPAQYPNIPSLQNRRLFAFSDCGVPDGIKCDTKGNVWAGCGDGIHVWNSGGLLIGKIVLGLADGNKGAGCANFCFVPGGLICLSEDRIYYVEGLAVEGAEIGRR